MMEGFFNGIKGMADKILNFVTELANKIVKKLKKALSIHSPSRVMAEIGMYTGKGLIVGMDGMVGSIEKASDNMAAAMMIDPQQATMDYALTNSASNLDIGRNGALAVSLNDTTRPQPANINLAMGANTYKGFAEDINQTNGNNTRLVSRYGI